MATPLAEDDLTRVSTKVAEEFTDAYYTALDSARNTIHSYYVPPSTISPGRELPLVTFNGTQFSDTLSLQDAFQNQMPFTHTEVQSLNVHVLNPQTVKLEAKQRLSDHEQNLSLLVQSSGFVRLQERKEGPLRGFSDTMVLVPNKPEVGGKGKAKTGEGRAWLIQTQNFRFVV